MAFNKKLSRILILGIAASSMLACTSYQMKYKNPSAQRGSKHSIKQSFFLWGHVGGDDVDLDKLCPQGVAEISSKSSFVDGMLFGLTVGLYSPMSVEVHCQSGTAYQVDSSGDTVSVNAISPIDR